MIAVGIMFLLLLGGVETTSSQILTSIGGENSSIWQSTTFWAAIIAGFLAFVATNRISVGGFSFQGSRESVMAGIAGAIYIFLASDMYSIVSKIKTIECAAGQSLVQCGSWELWVIWALIMPLMVGFGISLIKFIQGAD